MQQPIQIEAISAFEDNYIWLLHNGHDAIVIDPGDSAPVIAALKALHLTLSAILITHHHADHIGGVSNLKEHYSVPIYAPGYEQFPFQHIAVREGDHIDLPALDLTLSVLWLPGHTLGHIAFFNQDYLFCGDVLFGAGCGRLFEGTPAQMLHSLNRLKSLKTDTKVYCTHEYTCKNIDFALTVDPNNQALIDRKLSASQLRKENKPTLPTTIELELNTNPFLRCNDASIRQYANVVDTDELSVFSKIRTLRNHY
ncbi:MAG: hydroxyacylglutathione hydrolase [Methylophilaceae bacterium]|jgi:hydroxyacylglutathione hydrolase|nr:MAG: hydroxyacylglutathione hydrolase [Methylophilaceae bacterium]